MKQKIWWVCFIALFIASITLAIHTHTIQKTQHHQLTQMSKAIHKNFEGWKKADIDGKEAKVFNKDMFVAHDINKTLFTISIIVISIMTIFLLLTIIQLRRNKNRLVA